MIYQYDKVGGIVVEFPQPDLILTYFLGNVKPLYQAGSPKNGRLSN